MNYYADQSQLELPGSKSVTTVSRGSMAIVKTPDGLVLESNYVRMRTCD